MLRATMQNLYRAIYRLLAFPNSDILAFLTSTVIEFSAQYFTIPVLISTWMWLLRGLVTIFSIFRGMDVMVHVVYPGKIKDDVPIRFQLRKWKKGKVKVDSKYNQASKQINWFALCVIWLNLLTFVSNSSRANELLCSRRQPSTTNKTFLYI